MSTSERWIMHIQTVVAFILIFVFLPFFTLANAVRCAVIIAWEIVTEAHPYTRSSLK